MLREQGEQALQYSITEGYLPLREVIAERLNGFGITCRADQILITNGSQQALDLLSKIFIDPGDHVAGRGSLSGSGGSREPCLRCLSAGAVHSLRSRNLLFRYVHRL